MAEGGSETVLCRYFLSGCCRDGARCHFSHDRSTGVPDNVCRYYLRGECHYGDQCRYDHIKSNRNTTRNVKNNLLKNKINDVSADYLIKKFQNEPRKDSGSSSRSEHSNSNQCNGLSSQSGGMTVLRKRNSPSESQSVEGHAKESINNWISAPEFVPKNPLSSKSYADIVKPEDEKTGGRVPPKSASTILCPFNVINNCQFGDNCVYVHGDVCDLCDKPCLHPFDEDQRKQHRDECVKKHEQDMELSFAIQRSIGKCCGICMDAVLEKEPPSERRFGILEKCNHVFCLNCIRKWRGTKQFDSKTVRACPECRVPSDFVTPSSYWVEALDEKEKLILDYKKALSTKPCKYFQQGRGECPFGSACFYLHAYPDGRKAQLPPPRSRRRQNQDGEVELVERIYLWDFFDIHEDNLFTFSLDDMLDLISDSEEDTDWSDDDILLD